MPVTNSVGQALQFSIDPGRSLGELLATIRTGQVLTGRVVEILPFGKAAIVFGTTTVIAQTPEGTLAKGDMIRALVKQLSPSPVLQLLPASAGRIAPPTAAPPKSPDLAQTLSDAGLPVNGRTLQIADALVRHGVPPTPVAVNDALARLARIEHGLPTDDLGTPVETAAIRRAIADRASETLRNLVAALAEEPALPLPAQASRFLAAESVAPLLARLIQQAESARQAGLPPGEVIALSPEFASLVEATSSWIERTALPPAVTPQALQVLASGDDDLARLVTAFQTRVRDGIAATRSLVADELASFLSVPLDSDASVSSLPLGGPATDEQAPPVVRLLAHRVATLVESQKLELSAFASKLASAAHPFETVPASPAPAPSNPTPAAPAPSNVASALAPAVPLPSAPAPIPAAAAPRGDAANPSVPRPTPVISAVATTAPADAFGSTPAPAVIPPPHSTVPMPATPQAGSLSVAQDVAPSVVPPKTNGVPGALVAAAVAPTAFDEAGWIEAIAIAQSRGLPPTVEVLGALRAAASGPTLAQRLTDLRAILAEGPLPRAAAEFEPALRSAVETLPFSPEEIDAPARLERFVRDSGLGLEAKLASRDADGPAVSLSTDLKAVLLQTREALASSRTAEDPHAPAASRSKRASEAIEGTLQSLTGMQLANAPTVSVVDRIVLQLPLVTAAGLMHADLAIYHRKDGRRGDPESPVQLVVTADTKKLGPVAFRLSVTGKRVGAVIEVANERIARLFEDGQADFARRLEQAGFRSERYEVRHAGSPGAPAPGFTPVARLDLKV